MTLFEQWKDLIENQTEATFKEFWEEYSGAETKIYSYLLDNPSQPMTGTVGELAEKFQVRPVIFEGFLDGVNESIVNKNDYENASLDTEVNVEIIPETLFYNMVAADADYLYGLPQWLDILGEAKMMEIAKQYRASKTVKRDAPKVGRNDPCPCGSGKKYKKCCGKN